MPTKVRTSGRFIKTSCQTENVVIQLYINMSDVRKAFDLAFLNRQTSSSVLFFDASVLNPSGYLALSLSMFFCITSSRGTPRT